MPSQNPKKHHYVPKFLLSEFTIERTKDGLLWETDLEKHEQRQSTPTNSGYERHFYTGNFGPGLDPFGLERALAKCEDGWAPIIREINDSGHLPGPDEEAFADLMFFVAFLAMRGPTGRRYFSEWLATPERKNALVAMAVRQTKAFLEMSGLIEAEFAHPLENLLAEPEPMDVTAQIQNQVRAAFWLALKQAKAAVVLADRSLPA